MARTFVTNPLTGRTIQVGGATFNQLIFDAYDFINGELIRRENAPPIPLREYYYNIMTARRILYGSRRYFEFIHAGWDIVEDYYLIPPWVEDNVAQDLINIDRRRNLNQRREQTPPAHNPVTYEQIMDRHRDTLSELNVSLCHECFYPIKAKDGEHCEDCRPE